jgi:serine/threonine protein kinase
MIFESGIANMQAAQCENCGNSFDIERGCQVCLLQLGLSKVGANNAVCSSLPSIAELNSSFPQLEITRLIGRGGMGAIYQARQMSLDRDVALKLIAKEVSQDPSFVERFEREAKTLAKLSHPNIVTVYDFGYTSDGVAYLIMEFVDGINLREAMLSKSVGPEDALDIVATICRALEYAHSRGVIHRDIKPENILLGEDGSLKVVDFGIAKIVDDSVRTPTLTATRQVLGSLHYLAPEQLESPDQVDHRVDLYALGVVFYELLTGELPLGRYEPPSAFYNRVDQRVDSVVLKSLSRKPMNRFQNAREFGTEIQKLQTAPAIPATVTAETPPPLPIHHATPSQPITNCDVPFTYDTFGGLAEAIGMVFVQERLLCVEFRTRDKLMGILKSKSHLIRIPFEKLTRLELVSGVFSSKLIVGTNSLSGLRELPNAETGSVEFKIKNRDLLAAKSLLVATGFTRPGLRSLRKLAPEFGSKEYTNQAVFGALMVMCGIMNLGSTAVAQIINANIGHTNNASLACFAIGLAVMFAPVALIQLVGGILNFVLPMHPFNGAVTVVSMIPISPVWLISFPVAIWASPWMRGEADESTFKKPSWGATTLMFIRESRWSKFVAVANAAGLLLVANFAWVYWMGFYPSSVVYRVAAVDNSIVADEVVTKMRARLADVTTGAVLDFDSLAGRVTIRDWKSRVANIQTTLAIPGQVQLVWLVGTSDTDVEEKTWLPLAGKIALDGLVTGGEGLSTSLAKTKPTIDLKPELVAAVESKPTRLTLELTGAGRDLLAESRPESKQAAIGLVIAGMVEGVARSEAVSNKQIQIELCDQSKFGAKNIEAAVRGPILPYTLELISK